MSERRDDFVITQDTLRHYSKKLQELKNDEEAVKKNGINGMINDDIETNSKQVLDIAKSLDLKSSNTFKDHPDAIWSALTLYMRDLENSKKTLGEKLGDDDGIRFKWDKMDEEISKVAKIKKSLNSTNNNWNRVVVLLS